MYKKLFILSVAVQLCLVAASGVSRMHGSPSAEDFKQHFDGNGDGQVTREENGPRPQQWYWPGGVPQGAFARWTRQASPLMPVHTAVTGLLRST